MSDSHGRAETTLRAARLLVARGAEILLHLGDLGSPEVLEALARARGEAGGPGPQLRVVFGNIDRDRAALIERCRTLDIAVDDPVGTLAVAGMTLVFLHGHEARRLRAALAAGPDFLLHGHTHRRRDERRGRTRVINPGALHRAAAHTAALLELPSGRFKVIRVPRG